MPSFKSDIIFYLDETGNIVGPGLFISKQDQQPPGAILVTPDILNRIYQLGVMDGKMEVDELRQKQSQRIADAFNDLMPEEVE